MKKNLLLIFLSILFIFPAAAQKKDQYSTRSKKAISYYEEAEPFIIRRQFPQAINLLRQALEKDDEFTEAHFRIGSAYRSLNALDKAKYHLEKVISLTQGDLDFAGAYIALAELYFQQGKYKESLTFIDRFKSMGGINKRIINEVNNLEKNARFAAEKIQHPLDFNPQAMSKTVNKFPLQYFPVLTADNQSIIFTRREGLSAQHDEDIFVSKKNENEEWTAPVSISDNINTVYNEGTCAITADGRMLIFTSCVGRKGFGSCDLYVSYKTGDQWSEPENMGPSINSPAWESQPSLSADGKTLYFISDRRGGQGKRDIWISQMDEENQWQQAVNLGKDINTPDDEVSPFIHANGQVLYFASKGYPGFGGFDLYYTNKTGIDWSEPVNVGYPLNNSDDQVSLFVTADGKKGYYSYEQRSQGDFNSSYILFFDVPEEIRITNTSNYVKGKVFDAVTKEEIFATIDLYDILANSLISSVKSDSTNGQYLMVLTEGAEYALYASKPGYLFESLSFDYKEDKDLEPFHIDIYLQPVKVGTKTTLKNIFFEVDKYEIQEKSKTELDKIIRFLKENPTYKIEIGGHTDNTGADDYNKTLSVNRAKSVYNYLIAQGVPKARLRYKGYGEAQPIAPNDTEENKQLNRRIEFKVVE